MTLFRPAAHALVLVLVPASLIWWPIGVIPGLGTITISDAILITLWALTALGVGAARHLGWRARTAIGIALLPLAVGGLGALAAWLSSGSPGDAALELSLHLKKYGLAAVLPLALVVFPVRRLAAAVRVVIVCTLLASSLAVIFPELADRLPLAARIQEDDPEFEEGRSVGLGSNPNDFAYTSMGLAVLDLALARRRRGALAWAGDAIVLASAGFNVVASASRSGMLAAAAATAYLLVRWRGAPVARIAIAGMLAVAVVLGLRYDDAFAERTVRFFRQGAGEANLAGRLAAQRSALATAVEHPLGVGSRHTIPAMTPHLAGYGNYLGTTDSLYMDTLLASGFLGLVALLLLLRRGWLLISRCDDGRRRVLLQAGFIAFLTAGLASVSPASFFVAPTFFLLVAVSTLEPSVPQLS
ncbi:O-antigen ligase family protein [Anaeromyxobacter oryzae]|uniref:O-antigen ligase-related domain-containing protein n=1 Tax=Anaeromyxobacter oryzae TaxID=2918170 RepID=A0ABN6MMQ0_9BACT|nr:O-antigen ligase family protein [Anaeromyxobacter oryzae]BDG02304.1 hypothetical protein AMOR_13000 [Anaeromyxobacter oryzae]